MAAIPEPEGDAIVVGQFLHDALERLSDGLGGDMLYAAAAKELLDWLRDPYPEPPDGELPVSASGKITDRNAGHVRLTIYTGRNKYARGHSGTLTFRTDEWRELRARLEFAGFEIYDDTLEGSIQ